ncbi:unnamed protein product [Neospora caninum Liverpool]|uniref:DNA polymerase delta subunit 4 n=1 Tax=Neospora caninum (strain Liverpool) TaxID=572307 RepID=F0V9J8_NEOCL|nr:uncharacterized protein NCLIV_008915 [Neospora caninum Liverpool]CBZ50423.1 unnamed protein product [Neospora caninum Liverpool]CEL65031.1 TPA: hypothetical protein BN1204_008915_1 [Neospora caninum Liverpool]|eukprot:XP_003880457.1 uncharacterized protein NCLIV_008915 [Neospora caninum Liverpool]
MLSFYSWPLVEMSNAASSQTPKKGSTGGSVRTLADFWDHGSTSPQSSKGVRSKTKYRTAPFRLSPSSSCGELHQTAKKGTTEGAHQFGFLPELRTGVTQQERSLSFQGNRDEAGKVRLLAGLSCGRKRFDRFQGLSELLRNKLIAECQTTRHYILGDHEGQAGATDLERMLQRFDMAVQYGPCCGLSRSERWCRADELGMKPPAEVKQAIQLTHSDVSIFDQRLSRFGVTNMGAQQ